MLQSSAILFCLPKFQCNLNIMHFTSCQLRNSGFYIKVKLLCSIYIQGKASGAKVNLSLLLFVLILSLLLLLLLLLSSLFLCDYYHYYLNYYNNVLNHVDGMTRHLVFVWGERLQKDVDDGSVVPSLVQTWRLLHRLTLKQLLQLPAHTLCK